MQWYHICFGFLLLWMLICISKLVFTFFRLSTWFSRCIQIIFLSFNNSISFSLTVGKLKKLVSWKIASFRPHSLTTNFLKTMFIICTARWLTMFIVWNESTDLVRRTFYNSLGQEKATLNKLGHVERLSTLSQTSRLTSLVQNENGHSGRSVFFQPHSGWFDETLDNFSLWNWWNLSTDDWETGPDRLTHLSQSVHRVRPLLFGLVKWTALRCSYSFQQPTAPALSWLWTGGQLELTATAAVRPFRPNGMGRAI